MKVSVVMLTRRVGQCEGVSGVPSLRGSLLQQKEAEEACLYAITNISPESHF